MSSPFDGIAWLVIARLTETFGEAQRAHDSTLCWMVKPAPGRASINVILDHGPAGCLVWIFDPNRRMNGITERTIRTQRDIHQTIEHVQQSMADLEWQPSVHLRACG